MCRQQSDSSPTRRCSLGYLVLCVVALSGCAAGQSHLQSPTQATNNPRSEGSSSGEGLEQKEESIPEEGTFDAASQQTYTQGWEAWKGGDLTLARKSFDLLVHQSPRSARAQYFLGLVLERLGDSAGAEQAYRAAFGLRDGYEEALAAYALLRAHHGQIGEADAFLTEQHKRFPRSAYLTTTLGEIKSLAKDSGAAQKLAQDALQIDPNCKEAMVLIARDFYRLGRIDLAEYALRAILEGVGSGTPARDKNNAEALFLRGIFYKDSGRRLAALADFEKAYAQRPDFSEAGLHLGIMKLESGNAAEALPFLESAVRYAPQNPLAHLSLGDCARLLGNGERAKAELEKALELDGRLESAWYNLGLLYLFSPPFAGMTPSVQIGKALEALDRYKTMRGTKQGTGRRDDIEDLVNRAKAKQMEIKNAEAASATAPEGSVPSPPNTAVASPTSSPP